MNAIEKQIDSIAGYIKLQLDGKKDEGIKIDEEVIFGVVEDAVIAFHLFTQKTTPFLVEEIVTKYKETGILTKEDIDHLITKIAKKELPNYYI